MDFAEGMLERDGIVGYIRVRFDGRRRKPRLESWKLKHYCSDVEDEVIHLLSIFV